MTRQRNDEDRKREIRAAATRCFVQRGYTATRLSDIAHEAGLSKGGLYFHYPTKETIFHDILDGLSRAQAARWNFDLLAGQPAERTLTRLVVAHLRTLQEEPEEVRLHNLLVAMAVQDTTVRAKLEEVVQIVRDLYQGVIERGIKEGVFIADDAASLALSIIAYVNGLAALAALDVRSQLPVTPEQAAQNALRMVKAHSRASSVEFAIAAPKTN